MAQARRTRPRKRTSARAPRRLSAGAVGMLAVGLVSGAVLSVLYLGVRSGSEHGFGSGLKTLFAQPEIPTQPPDSKVPETEPTAKTKFDFYTVLPAIERVIPDSDFTEPGDTARRRPDRGPYVLQVASYANAYDAERLKLKLKVSGMAPYVQKIAIEGKGVYYRVRLGPYTNRRQLKNTKQRLAKLGLHGITLRLSDQ